MFAAIRGSRVFFAGFVMAIFCSGCATGGGANSVPLRVVQTVQVGDDALDCATLGREIANADAAVATLSRKIDSSKTMAWANEMTRMINRSTGQNNLVANMVASRMTGSIDDLREVRDSHQRRRDVLIQQHMHKQCAHQAQMSQFNQ